LTLNTLSHESGAKEGLPLSSDLSIEEAMQEMIVSDHDLVTVMKEGKSIGQVSLSDMVAAIAKPKTTQTGEANAYR
jgi:predicted transcriptional regulator